jgi:hypothetical protein
MRCARKRPLNKTIAPIPARFQRPGDKMRPPAASDIAEAHRLAPAHTPTLLSPPARAMHAAHDGRSAGVCRTQCVRGGCPGVPTTRTAVRAWPGCWLRQAPHGRCGGAGTNCRVGLYQAHRPRASGATLGRRETRPASHGKASVPPSPPVRAGAGCPRLSANRGATIRGSKRRPRSSWRKPGLSWSCMNRPRRWPSRPRPAVVWRGKPPSRRANASAL